MLSDGPPVRGGPRVRFTRVRLRQAASGRTRTAEPMNSKRVTWARGFALACAACGDAGTTSTGFASLGASADPSPSSSSTVDVTSSATTSSTAGAETDPSCEVGTYRCAGEVLQACAGENTWLELLTCDPLLGLTCDVSGKCVGACASLGAQNPGCDYYPVTALGELGHPLHKPAIAVTNVGEYEAILTLTLGPDTLAQHVAPPGGTAVVAVPGLSAFWSHDSILASGGAYRLRSTRPVSVFQLAPRENDVSADASMLLPINVWSRRYVVASWPYLEPFNSRGLVAVVAGQDDTTVTLIPPGGGTPTKPLVEGVESDGHGTFVLNASDVAQILTANFGDLTGMQVLADKPVQVFGGHQVTSVPWDSYAGDHLEEVILPVELLAREYAVVPPASWQGPGPDKPVVVRIIAAEGPTTLQFAPDQPAQKFLAAIGDFVELGPTTERFVVSADQRILIAEYVVSQDSEFGMGDPSMVQVLPRALQRSDYLVYADPSWEANHVDLVAPLGAAIQVDGAPVTELIPIGASGLVHAHVLLSNAGDGSHRVLGDVPFGLSVYGVGYYGSFWYPAGLPSPVAPR